MLKTLSKCFQRPARASAQNTLVAFRRGRTLLTLAIETSCDDTSVAILETCLTSAELQNSAISTRAHLHFHKKVTADNSAYSGINPLIAVESHQTNLANLVHESLQHLPNQSPHVSRSPKSTPDFITVTRGPGMRSALRTGLDTAKGLAVAWQIPLLAINHMQAHALTPRLVSALNTPTKHDDPPQPTWQPTPAFPFLTLLVSGGHTLLVHTRSATDHTILSQTLDIAIGDCLDKMARLILPADILHSSPDTMYGRLLERFVFPDGPSDHSSALPPPDQNNEPITFTIPTPLVSGGRRRRADLSFAGFESVVQRALTTTSPNPIPLSLPARRAFARECMRVAFSHLAQRVVWAFQDLAASPPSPSSEQPSEEKVETHSNKNEQKDDQITTLVLSGGVASNAYLRTLMREWLDRAGLGRVEIVAPPPELCTDNAAMVGWCGVEMWERGWESGLDVRAVRKWSVDSRREGEKEGILEGVEGWKRRRGWVGGEGG